MVTRISKWGNSLGIRLPKGITDSLQLRDGSEIEIEERDGTVIILPIEKNVMNLDQLIEGMNEIDVKEQFEEYGEVGKEIID